MKRFDNKIAVVTGASGGIGKEIAIGFAEEGASLAICARTESKLNETAEICRKLGVEVLAITCDVSEYSQLENFVNKINEKFGRIDILVNNAVSSDTMIPFIDQTIENLEKALKSGLYATWHMMQLSFPLMKEHGGSIINFGSSASNGQPGLSSYGVAKAAITALTRAVASEWGEYNIRVNNMKPFAMTENMKNLPEETRVFIEKNMKNSTALKRTGTPKSDIVPVVLFLASDESQWMTGQTLNAEGGSDIHE